MLVQFCQGEEELGLDFDHLLFSFDLDRTVCINYSLDPCLFVCWCVALCIQQNLNICSRGCVLMNFQ